MEENIENEVFNFPEVEDEHLLRKSGRRQRRILSPNQIAKWLTSSLYIVVTLIGLSLSIFLLVELTRLFLFLHKWLGDRFFN